MSDRGIAMFARLFLAVTAVLALGGTARAQSAETVLAQAGLFGRWASDCSQPANSTNTHSVYAVNSSGVATLTYDHGPEYKPTSYTIPSARKVAPGRISYEHVNQATGARLSVVLLVTATHIRVWTSRRGKEVLVRNGKFVKAAGDSPLQARCP